jgi:adhesin transport system outer membrane protein
MKLKILAACLAGTFLTGIPHNSSAETLGEALAHAVKTHPTVMAAKANSRATAESVLEEKSAYYPTANATASFGRVFADNTTTRGLSTVRGTGYSWYGDGRLALNQKIYDWSATSNRIQSAKSRYMSSESQVNGRQQFIAFQATQAFIQAVRAQDLKDQAETHLGMMKDYYQRIETLVDNGGADESELSRAQDFVSLAENTLAQIDADYDIAMASYVEAVGRLPEGDLEKPSFDMTSLPDTIDEAVTLATSSHPQIISAQKDAQAALYERRAEETNLYPTFDAELSYAKKDQKDLIGGESEDARALLKMNWDMSLGGGELAAQRRLAARAKEADFIADELSRTIARDVKISWTSLALAARQKNSEAERLEAALQTLETFKEQYDGGQKKILDLMVADAQVFAAQQGYTNFVYREMDAAFALKSLLGQKLLSGSMSEKSDHGTNG